MNKRVYEYALFMYILSAHQNAGDIRWEDVMNDNNVWDICYHENAKLDPEVWVVEYNNKTRADVIDRRLHQWHVEDPDVRVEAIKFLIESGIWGDRKSIHNEFSVNEDDPDVKAKLEKMELLAKEVNSKLAELEYEAVVKVEYHWLLDHVMREEWGRGNDYGFTIYGNEDILEIAESVVRSILEKRFKEVVNG